MKTAIYARFSSTLQNERSIDDQVRLCRERAEREGWEVVDVFADYAISGAVRERPALNAMLARAAEFDQVAAEAIDRISRDLEDIAGIHKRLTFARCRIFTLSEGEIGDMHVAFNGGMAAMFRRNLADKIRRGQKGRVASGRIPGGLCYGYRKVARLDARGEPELGLREIDPDQADVIRRIYREFLAGLSPRSIAQRLNAEGVPAPSGGKWRDGTINGDPVRANGILRNPIYAGVLVYNRTSMVRDPATRKRVSRVNPESEWQRHDVPDLRIVDQADWEAVQRQKRGAGNWSFQRQRRPKRLLSGLLRCGDCGDPYVVIGQQKWGCRGHRTGGGCVNGRTIDNAPLERRVLAGLKDRLLDPELVSICVKEYHEQHVRARRDESAKRAKLERKLADVAGKVDRFVAAIGSGAGGIEEIVQALAKARAERSAIQRELADIESMPVIALHPRVAADYRAAVETLTDTLHDDPEAMLDAVPAIRSLIDQIVLTPRDHCRGLDVDLHGRLANLIALATGRPVVRPEEGMLSVVAEERSGLKHTPHRLARTRV
jgi:site-specific DNA recombinase